MYFGKEIDDIMFAFDCPIDMNLDSIYEVGERHIILKHQNR